MAKSPRDQRRVYLESASKLRQAINVNRQDADFSNSDEHRIDYIIDTNIFIFFANLKDRKSITRDLDNLVGKQSPQDVQMAVERLTAAFLFSGRLPGQDGNPSYVTVPHFREILFQIEKMSNERQFSVPGRTREARARNAADLQRAIGDILQSSLSREEKWRRIAAFAPKRWLNALDTYEHFSRAAQQMFLGENATILPLDEEPWGRRASVIMRDDKADWTRLLSRNRKPTSKAIIEDDAEALATIVNLYRQDPEARYDDRKRLYLLITTDSAIERAVSKAMPELEAEGIPYFLRSPRDYLPIFNLRSMRDEDDEGVLDSEVRRRFNGVYEALTSALEWIDISQRDDDRSDIFGGRLEPLQKSWGEISDFAAVLNAKYFARGTDGAFDALSEFVSKPSGAKVGANLAKSVAVELRNQHLLIVVSNALAALRAARAVTETASFRRVHLKVIGDVFGVVLGPYDDVNHLLDAVVQGEPLPEATRHALRTQPDRPSVQLVASCLFLAAGKWNAAAELAGRAVEIATGSAARIEGSYLQAISIRLSMKSMDQFAHAGRLLRNNLYTYYRGGRGLTWTLRRLRDEIELGTLMVSGAVTQSIANWRRRLSHHRSADDIFIMTDDFLHHNFARGVELIQNAYQEIRSSEPFDFREGRNDIRGIDGADIITGLKIQALTNICGAYVFERLLPGPQGAAPVTREGEVWLQRLRRQIDAGRTQGWQMRPTQEIYEAALTVLCSTDAEEVQLAHRRAIEALVAATRGQDLAICDELEFEFLEAALEERSKILRAQSRELQPDHPPASSST